jgi:DNA-binding CsgD family transcriptional regulator
LLGAAEGQRERTGFVRPVPAEDELTPVVADIRTALGKGGFEQAMSEGRALSLEEAVAYASRGRGRHRRARSGWESLTGSELRVVALVGQHLSNAEIAERLFVTTTTVKSHLNRVFAKLGVTNRGHLAAMAHHHVES